MSGNDILIDTNILLYFLNGDKDVKKFFIDYNPIISFITELEVLSSPELTDDDKANIGHLLNGLTILTYNDKHKQAVLNIRAAKRLKLPDAIIAATAITAGIPLVTADESFKNTKSLHTIFYRPVINE
ncbi:PIN domain-containing protein [Mucilaginibacter mali]|uniref:Ribonuclease VapC n=1 Tax=Mucilaginibacter mali TaxID=2740462 RepID=A0A7D4Q2Y6_9SPHI|nr:PIN domain-containing protein [Mucilaginibacter mali]QKJ31746.1 PIN domain-containing protein [Mucilaginibacter mali]